MDERSTSKVSEENAAPSVSKKETHFSENILSSPPRIRRVGTFTMGISLIAAGVIAMICLFFPSDDILILLRFSPLVLIFLGVEILFNHLLHRYDRLKYDFLSGFVCFALICASVSVALIPPFFEQYGPARERLRETISDQVETLCYQTLSENKAIQSMSSDFFLFGGTQTYPTADSIDLRSLNGLHLSFTLAGIYPDKTEFAQAIRKILDRLEALPLSLTSVSFQSHDKIEESTRSYTLELTDSFALHQDTDGLSQMVEENFEDSHLDQMDEECRQLQGEIEAERQSLEEERQQLYRELEAERQQQQMEFEKQYHSFGT